MTPGAEGARLRRRCRAREVHGTQVPIDADCWNPVPTFGYVSSAAAYLGSVLPGRTFLAGRRRRCSLAALRSTVQILHILFETVI